jgi:FlaG/FlaF family flagellin (archaellin)
MAAACTSEIAGRGGEGDMYDDEDAVAPVTVGRALHVFVPWIVLAAVIMAVISAFMTFQRSDKPTLATEPVAGSTQTTSTAKEIKGLEAVARTDLKLRALPNDQSEVIANVKKKAVLDILLKDAGHFKVRDKAGHIGWVPNDSEFISVRDKKK